MKCEIENCNKEAMPCYLEDIDKPDYHYCSKHAVEEGFCCGCGNFYAGTNEFDFKHPGWCDNCYDEIDNDDFDDDEDNWQPCDNCDLPDACYDFGCAIKNGIRDDDNW